MKSETAQICRIVINARKALAIGQDIDDIDISYVSELSFSFLENRDLEPVVGNDPEVFRQWFKTCKWWGLQDVKYILTQDQEDGFVVGQAAELRGAIVCYWRSGDVTYFASDWQADRERQGWKVTYQECAWEDVPEGIADAEDHTEDLMTVLRDLAELADRISERHYSDIFWDAYYLLDDPKSAFEYPETAPDLPERFQRIFLAVLKSDVIGGTGSWKDGPAYSAARQGLEADYDILTERLQEQIDENLMYVVNNCWPKEKE